MSSRNLHPLLLSPLELTPYFLEAAFLASLAAAESPSTESNWARPEMVRRTWMRPAPPSRSSHRSWVRSLFREDRSREQLKRGGKRYLHNSNSTELKMDTKYNSKSTLVLIVLFLVDTKDRHIDVGQ